jgi:hypothetical protein
MGCMNNNTISKQRFLPDPEICQTACVEQSLNLWDCLVENPEGCEHAVRVGSSVICRHPDRRSFEKAAISAEFNQGQVNRSNIGGQ